MNNIEEIARARQDIHKGHSTQRLSKNIYDEDTVGVAGEVEFSKQFNTTIDSSVRIKGDGGVDFTINGITIDVKTARKPYNILVKEHEINRIADVIVLAKYEETGFVKLIGWATKEEMKQCPKRVFNEKLGIVNYYKHASTLRGMDELQNYLRQK